MSFLNALGQGLGQALPMAGAAAGGYAQGHVQKQQMDQQRQTGDAQRLLMALQAAAAQRDAAPVSDEWQQSMQTNAPGFSPVQGGTLRDQAIPYQAFAASEAAKKAVALARERAQYGVDQANARDAKVQARYDGVDADRDRDYALEERKVLAQERRLKLDAIRAMKITDPKVLRFMNRGPAEKALVEDAARRGVMSDLLAELYNRGKWDPDEGESGNRGAPPAPNVPPPRE